MKCQVSILLASLAVAVAQQHYYDPHYTLYENNFDFTGKDLNNTKHASKEHCFDDCLKQPGCHAYSFNDYNGGTCWLKESKGEAVFKPGVVSTVIYSTFPMVCQLQDGVDFVDNDLDHVDHVAKAEDCCDKCKLLDKCRAYSWSSDNGGTCWFKTKRGTAFYKAGVKSGEIFPNDPVKPAYYVDLDFVGHDIGPAPGKFEACGAACKAKPGCRAFTWTDHQGGTCWLKAKKDKTAAKVGAKSFVIDKVLVAPKTKYQDVSFHDNDFVNVAGIAEAEDCVQICADWANGECKAVTWSDYMKGTCWLKHAEGIHDKADGQISYVL